MQDLNYILAVYNIVIEVNNTSSIICSINLSVDLKLHFSIHKELCN